MWYLERQKILLTIGVTTVSGKKRQGKNGRALSPAAIRLLKILYFTVFGISLAIVGVYLFLTFGVRPPEPDDPPAISSPSPSGTQDPDPSESVTGTGGDGEGEGNGESQDTPEPVQLVRREQVYTCLIFGLDDGYGNTDTIMVASFDVPNKRIGLISIPRDTKVAEDLGAAFNKVNAVYSQRGAQGLEAELEELLGIPIDYYVKVRLTAFERLVNAIGGVYFDVPVDMHYFDPDQDLRIDLEAGSQLLDGEQAMGLVRFRQDNEGVGYGDTGRTQTQQAFLKAMLSQVISGASLEDIPTLVDILLNYVETDAGLNDMIYFGRELVGMDIGSAIQTATLPTHWSSPYMWVEEEDALAVINEYLNPYTTPVTPEMVEFFKP